MAKDEQLPVAQARAGDPAAWDALFRRYQLPLYSYVQELMRHEQTSLDIVQETFIKAVRHLGSLRADAKFSGWLFRIAHQLCQQYWRKVRPTEPLDDMSEGELAADLESPLDELLAKEDEQQFLAALGKLPEDHRSVLLLHYLEEFDLAEIADIAGIPLGTVKSRLHNARQKLREQLSLQLKS